LLALPWAKFLTDAATPGGRQPNIVFILADDLGYMDIGANNPKTFYETPHIDRLAAEGMRLTAFYSMPLCSPSRACLILGQHAAHTMQGGNNAGAEVWRKDDGCLDVRQPAGFGRNDGHWYAAQLAGLRDNPGCIGAHLCGAFLRNRARQRGVLDEQEQPDTEMIELIRQANRQTGAWLVQQ
jgi:hypothetical protein